jgi:hypothetical protein
MCLGIPLSVSIEITVGTKYCRFPASPRTHVSSGGAQLRCLRQGTPYVKKRFGRVSQIQIRITSAGPLRHPRQTGHSTVGTSGLIVIPLLVRQDVKGRAERDFSSPFNRVNLLKRCRLLVRYV